MIETRYMTDDKTQRIVAHLFYPIGGVIDEDADTPGSAMLASREHPGDVWPVPHELAGNVPYSIWKRRVEDDGFIYAERS